MREQRAGIAAAKAAREMMWVQRQHAIESARRLPMTDNELRKLWLAANERLERQGYIGGNLANDICEAIPRLLAEKERLRAALEAIDRNIVSPGDGSDGAYAQSVARAALEHGGE